MPNLSRRTALCLLAMVVACLSAPNFAASAPSDGLSVVGSVQSPLTLTSKQLQELPRQSVEVVHPHTKKTLRFEGVLLSEILKKASLPSEHDLRGASVRRVILAEASDGYIAAFAWAELDPSIGDAGAIVADRVDGHALSEKDGPLQLIAPKDKRPTRWVRGLVTIRVQ